MRGGEGVGQPGQDRVAHLVVTAVGCQVLLGTDRARDGRAYVQHLFTAGQFAIHALDQCPHRDRHFCFDHRHLAKSS